MPPIGQPVATKVRRVLIAVLFAVAIYFGLALVLVFLPSAPPSESRGGLDFARLAISENAAGETRTYLARDGRELFYRYFSAASPNLVVLIHGSASDSRYLAQLARSIAESGSARVAVPDLRGHRNSAYRKGDIRYLDQLEHDLADFILVLTEDNAEAAVVLAGHSSGGGLVVRYAGNQQLPSVDGFLLYAPYLGYDAPTVRENSGGWAHPNVPRIIGLNMLNIVGVRAMNHLPVIKFNLPPELQDELTTTEYSYRLNVSYAPRDYQRDLAAIEGPLLLIAGEDDEAFHAARFAQVAGKTPGREVYIVDDESHLGIVSNKAAIRKTLGWFEQFK